jgi:hypothetical protein
VVEQRVATVLRALDDVREDVGCDRDAELLPRPAPGVRLRGLDSLLLALYEAFRLLGWVGSPQGAFSNRAIRSVRVIRNCAKVTVGLIFVGVVILMFTGDERPPAAFMGLLATLAFLVIGASAAALERLLQSAVDLKSDNDLTV